MKVAIKALNEEHGKEVIKYLESIGGRNKIGLSGSGIDTYYYIWKEGVIMANTIFPIGYTEIQLPKEETLLSDNNKNNKTMYKSFAITGSQPLLKAMEETLVKEGFISSKMYSFINGTEEDKEYLTCNYEYPENDRQLKSMTVSNNIEGSRTFNLPDQWNEALDFILGQLKPKIEVGSWVVITKSGWGTNPADIGMVCQIVNISSPNDLGYSVEIDRDKVGNNDRYTCLEALRLATPEEIEAAQTVKIGDYKAEKTGNTIKFGCQSFTKEELQAYKKLLNDNINAKIEISGTIIIKDMLNRLINKL